MGYGRIGLLAPLVAVVNYSNLQLYVSTNSSKNTLHTERAKKGRKRLRDREGMARGKGPFLFLKCAKSHVGLSRGQKIKIFDCGVFSSFFP